MGTIAEKLQKMIDNKQLIVDSVNLKAGTSFDLDSKLSDVAEAIQNISTGSSENLLQKKINATGAYGLFAYWKDTNLDELINSLDFSNITDMSYMFRDCIALVSIPLLNTSNATNMYFMFYKCEKLTTIPQLDTSKAIDMSYMFSSCRSLTSIPQLDTSSATNMYNMFYYCSKITTIPQLNTSKVTDMCNMFFQCSKLTTIDITYYNISSTSKISNFVRNCTALKSLIIRAFGANYIIDSNSFMSSSIESGTGYIYVPRAMVDTLKSATNWSIYASQIRALEDYTVDGTTTGALDETKI